MGVSETDAIRIASGEMEGAAEINGNINSTQTNCNVLNYNEALPDSKGRKEGKNKTLRDLGVGSEAEADQTADAWVKSHGGWGEKKG